MCFKINFEVFSTNFITIEQQIKAIEMRSLRKQKSNLLKNYSEN